MSMAMRRSYQESRCRTSDRDRESHQAALKSRSSSKSQSGKKSLVEILRRITMAVQVFPFIYTAMFVFLFSAYSISEGVWLDIIDYVFFVSPAVVIAHIVYSRMLKLCKWHRIACMLPLIPQAVDQFDTYVHHFDHNAWVVVASTIVVTMILFLIAIYKVFFTEDGRICR